MYSVIIPTFNGLRTIELCLDSVFNQKFEKPFEVIVVDSSQDSTPEIVRQRYSQARLIRFESQTPESVARNIGVDKARGDIIVMTDQDCVVAPDWLSRIDSAMEKDDWDAVGGSVNPSARDDFYGRISFLVEFGEFLSHEKPGFKRSIPTCNIAYRKRVFQRNRRFCPEFPIAEDLIFNSSLVSDGGIIYFDPNIRVTHINRKGLKAVLGHQVYLGIGSAKARRLLQDLPGSFLIKFPVFLPLLPIYRWFLVVTRLGRHSPADLLKALLYGLPILLIVAAWSFGFCSEVGKGTAAGMRE